MPKLVRRKMRQMSQEVLNLVKKNLSQRQIQCLWLIIKPLSHNSKDSRSQDRRTKEEESREKRPAKNATSLN